MKFFYNRFVKAIAMLLLLITAICAGLSLVGTYYMYSNDIVDKNGTFQETEIAESMITSNAHIVINYIDSLSYDNFVKSNVDENGVFLEDEAVYDVTSKDIAELLKNEVHKTYILERMGGLTKNYKFEVLFNDEVLVSNFDRDKSGLEYISNDIFIVDEQGSIIVNNYLNKELVKGDLFYRKSQIFDTIYRNYDSIKYIGIICGIAAVILFVYIMIIAGYNDKGELEEFWIDKIPYELLLTLEFVISYVFLAAYGSYDRIISYIVLIAFLSIWYLISINIFVSTLSRLKNRVFIKNTLIGEISRILAKMIKNIVLNMNSYPKAAMILAICFMGEIFIEIYAWATHIAFANFLWFIIKICQFIMLLYIFAMIVKLKNLIKNVYEGKIDNQESMEGMKGIFEESARYLNDISSGLEKAVAEKVKSEQLKTELITNVSHDIKTPLTSIINYIDLMNKEEIQNPKVKEYINVAYKQSIRLKKLTEDLIEASKAATGNIEAKLKKNQCMRNYFPICRRIYG